MKRAQMIEDAAKALFEGGDGLDSSPETRAIWEPRIRAALAVFEEAHTPTDDEREALAIARNIVNQIGDFYYERIPSSDWVQVRQETNDELDAFAARLIAGFRRTVQGEPTDAQVFAALNAYWGGEENARALGSVEGMRAALRAAAGAEGGER